MGRAPPLSSLPFFEAAGRHESFAKAAEELSISSTAVANRVKTLEQALGFRLFRRHRRGVSLNPYGRAYLRDVQRILIDFDNLNQRLCDGSPVNTLRLVSAESLASQWLIPRITEFQAAHPQLRMELETDHDRVQPARDEFDVRIAFTDEVGIGLHAETLFEEALIPVCSRSFLEAHGSPTKPDDLVAFPLLYDLACGGFWSHWFAYHDVPAPNLTMTCGFRLHTLMIRAAVNGMGIALGHFNMIERELEMGKLVHLFGPPVAAPARYVLVTKPQSSNRPDIRAFRTWILNLAGKTGDGRTSTVAMRPEW